MIWLKHFRIWITHNWLKAFLGIFGVLIIALLAYGIFCFRNLESFYRDYMFAQMPVQMPMYIMHTIIFIAGYYYLLRGGMAKNAKAIPPNQINVHFSDVIGIDEAKEECMEVVELMKDHKRIHLIGGKIIKGLLMIGPPGCGKTYLAKAIACETGVPFLSMAGSEFVEMYVGVGASRVRKLFKDARRYANIYGQCIIFIDEIDAIARNRNFTSFGGGGQETNSTQNMLLVELDGLNEGTGSNVIVVGATNAPIESLDEALLRPGRFDRKIVIDKPYAEGRNELFKYYLGKVRHDPTIDTMRLANYTIGKSPADIENIIKESSLICTRDKRKVVEQKDLTAALERIDLGQERRRKIHPIELNRTAVHESGHAILTYFLHPIDDVFKVSVVTRMETLGVMHHQPIVEMEDYDQTWYESAIAVSLAGHAAEKLTYETTTSGCSGDFKSAMYHAKRMVRFGMGPSGLVGDYNSLDKEFSVQLKQRISDDIVAILDKCMKEATDILTREKVLLQKMAEVLVDKKTLEYDEVTALCKTHGVGQVRRIEERGLLQEFHRNVGK